MKKFKNWTKKPITWGGLLKLSGVSMAAGLLMSAPIYVAAIKSQKAFNDSLNELDDEVTE